MNALAQAFLLVLAVSPATRGHPFFDGRLAQRLERSPHTREVKGSNPLSPTTSPHSPIFVSLPGVNRASTVPNPPFALRAVGFAVRYRRFAGHATRKTPTMKRL